MQRFDSTRPTAPHLDAAAIRATIAGTAEFAQRFQTQFTPEFFRTTTFGATVSSVGLGTYLGESDAAADAAYEASIKCAVSHGINLIDTAINYRGQRSERTVGLAMEQIFTDGVAARQGLVVCSKGGYIPLEQTPPATRAEYQVYVQREFIDTEILRPEDIVAGGHSLAPRFLRYCLAKSRQNLGVRTIDVYYLHNPEQQQPSVGREELFRRIRAAFGLLEEAVTRGEIGVYGVSTWEGFRVAPGDKSHLNLEALVEVAREVAGDAHHFAAVQLPFSLAMPEAATAPTQTVAGRPMTLVQAAAELGVTVIGSATLMQGKVAAGLPPQIRSHFPACTSDAQCAIEFARGAPGVSSSLVGMKSEEHIAENLMPASKRAGAV